MANGFSYTDYGIVSAQTGYFACNKPFQTPALIVNCDFNFAHARIICIYTGQGLDEMPNSFTAHRRATFHGFADWWSLLKADC